jgi:molybdopterin molybdotransferase/putative molybdopterin biosynthesis protein
MASKLAKPAERLRRARESLAISQADLARRAGISRQALGAIESGSYSPGVAVALALARELGESVEALFAPAPGRATVEARIADAPRAGATVASGTRVALARIGGRVMAVSQPAATIRLAPAAGLIERAAHGRAAVDSFRSQSEIDATVLVAGCDPAVTLLADWVARRHTAANVIALPTSSRAALQSLAERRAHAAGVHLRDARTGEYNLTPARRALGHRRTLMLNFARWELGLATAPGNPLAIRGFADLARPRIRIVNREQGSGARLALDEALRALELDAAGIAGYGREAAGHLEVAAEIAAGHADAGVTIRVAAEAYGLGFITIREERYDLAIAESERDSPGVRAILDALNSAAFGREVSELCSYDTRDMGNVVARIS